MKLILTETTNKVSLPLMKRFKDLLKRILTFFYSGSETSVIVICFLLSTLFWVLIKFSKEYTYYIDYPIDYVNLPLDKYFKDEPLDNLQIKVKGFGFNFLKEVFTKRNLAVNVSGLAYHNPKESNFFLTASHLPEISSRLSGFTILSIEPDTLFLKYSTKTKRTVQVKVLTDVAFRENYKAYSSLKVSPDKVDLFGPDDLIDSINVVYTEPLILDDVVNDIKVSLAIVLPDKLISSPTTEVNIVQDVERFTQINKIVPIRIKNLPKGLKPIIKPSDIELSFWVAMQDVDKVSDSYFDLFCDYNEVLKSNSSVLNVFIDKNKYPSIVKLVKYNPTTVEYFDLQ